MVLTNAGTAACPITGTLWGSGTLSGLFTFEGGWLCVTVAGNDLVCPQYQNASGNLTLVNPRKPGTVLFFR